MLMAKNGFVSEFQVYVGKTKEAETGLEARVVKDLTRNIVGKSDHIYCVNFFTSIGLFQELLDKKIYAYRMIRSNRKFFPEEFKLHQKKDLNKEESKSSYKVKT